MTSQNELDQKAMGGTELMGLGLESRLDPELLDRYQIIRSRVREIDPDKKAILWLHDLPGDPESAHLRDPESRKRFKKIVFVSHWQQQQYHDWLGIPFDEGVVIKNAITPFTEEEIVKPTDKIRLIYHPTPHRGLQILVPVFEKLAEASPDIELDVFSSFKLYGWEQRDEPYKELIQRCIDHPQINYHGSQPNSVVREALGKAHIFAYPSIWQETSCICLMEAMSAGTLPVYPIYGALGETGSELGLTYAFTEDMNKHASMFYWNLATAIQHIQTNQNPPPVIKNLADARYNWDTAVFQWEQLLRSL